MAEKNERIRKNAEGCMELRQSRFGIQMQSFEGLWPLSMTLLFDSFRTFSANRKTDTRTKSKLDRIRREKDRMQNLSRS